MMSEINFPVAAPEPDRFAAGIDKE